MKASHSKASKHKPIKVKVEKSDGKQIQTYPDDKDLTFYVKDRVELMRQIFKILKDRELLAMAPDYLRGQKLDGLQEALLDEVLGISSKRLHSILEGLECPSNTDSSEESSADAFETISLDSISSDEDDILSPHDHKTKKKHPKKKSKVEKEAKKKNKMNDDILENDNAPKGKKNKKDGKDNQKSDDASGTGMTVLELLELQARARAIRAQLAAVEIKDEENDSAPDSSESDEDEVVIKEEPPEIVEIQSSSDEDKGDQRKANSSIQNQTKSGQSSLSPLIKVNPNYPLQNNESQSKSRKIKLNRTNLLVSVTNNSKTVTSGADIDSNIKSVLSMSLPKGNAPEKSNSFDKNGSKDKLESSKTNSSNTVNISNSASKPDQHDSTLKGKYNKSANSDKSIDKNKNSLNKESVKKDQALFDKIMSSYNKANKKQPILRERKESEEDEITLELSDSEKMDLLEGFHSPKFFESEDIDINLSTEKEIEDCSAELIDENSTSIENTNRDAYVIDISKIIDKSDLIDTEVEISHEVNDGNAVPVNLTSDIKNSSDSNENSINFTLEAPPTKSIGIKRKKSRNIKKKHKKLNHSEEVSEKEQGTNLSVESAKVPVTDNDSDHNPKSTKSQDDDFINKTESECGIEIADENHEILCISDDHISEDGNDDMSNPNSDDKIQTPKVITEEIPKECTNVSTDKSDNVEEESIETITSKKNVPEPILVTENINDQTKIDEATSAKSNTNIVRQNENEEYADCILEISDDSEGEVSVGLSKEPTREEIEELSRKIDYEIDRENLNIIGDSNINLEIVEEPSNSKEEIPEGVSWKTRWLKSDKVQRVLATSNLCNALRKKNKDLKKKLENEQIKNICINPDKVEEISLENKVENIVIENKNELEEIEGSVSQYEKLSASTKYVNPVVEPIVDEKTMLTDAKVLMKMYKKLLKIQNLDEDEKKKAKKQKKDKKRDKKEKKKNKSKVMKSPELPTEDNSTQESIESLINP
ncbi:uncharacterized protein LOC143909388 isoform X2 [Arctopsyche grandis]|uniref:uncharacterized protein LOC143909388 isoform X2 n=1 Tax=Arctopsyche grandis TaxID=121162 RepID=UPI00406D9423